MRRNCADELDYGTVVRTVKIMKQSGRIAYVKDGQVTQRNSYTVEFRERDQEQSSFAMCSSLSIKMWVVCYIIRRIEEEEWPVLFLRLAALISDILDVYVDVQTLLGKHIIPAQETQYVYIYSCNSC